MNTPKPNDICEKCRRMYWEHCASIDGQQPPKERWCTLTADGIDYVDRNHVFTPSSDKPEPIQEKWDCSCSEHYCREQAGTLPKAYRCSRPKVKEVEGGETPPSNKGPYEIGFKDGYNARIEWEQLNTAAPTEPAYPMEAIDEMTLRVDFVKNLLRERDTLKAKIDDLEDAIEESLPQRALVKLNRELQAQVDQLQEWKEDALKAIEVGDPLHKNELDQLTKDKEELMAESKLRQGIIDGQRITLSELTDERDALYRLVLQLTDEESSREELDAFLKFRTQKLK